MSIFRISWQEICNEQVFFCNRLQYIKIKNEYVCKMKLKKTLKILFLMCFLAINAQLPAQTHFLHYTTTEGLPGNKVYCAVQDKAGFMWFGTDNGLVRFNGSEFKTFTVRDGLPDNDIFSVFEDAEGRLWILGFKQAPCFYYRNRLYTSNNDTFLSKYFKDPDMFRYTINRNLKRILFYVIYKERAAMLEYGKFSLLDHIARENARHFIKCPVLTLFNDGKQDYLMNSGMIYHKKIVKRYSGLSDLDQVRYRNINVCFYYDVLLKKVVAARMVNDTLQVLRTYSIGPCLGPYNSPSNELFFVSEDRSIYTLDTASLDLVRENVPSFSGRMSTAAIDNRGNKWICTHDNGVFVYPKYSSEILSQKKGATCLAWNPSENKVIAGFEDRSILESDGNRNFENYFLPELSPRQSRITSIVYYKGNLYVGGDNKMGKYDVVRNISVVLPDQSVNVLSTVKDMELCRNGSILVGSANGAGFFSPDSGRISEILWGTRTTAVCDVPGKGVFLGTINGLHVRLPGGKGVTEFVSETSLDRARITDIKYDGKGRIWVGTAQYGVFIIDGKNITNLDDSRNSRCFITSYYVKSIFIDPFDVAWVGTDKGINRIMYKSSSDCRVERVTASFGIPNDNISALFVRGDTVYMTSLDGVSRFRYNSAILREVPGLELTGLFMNGDRQGGMDGNVYRHFENNISLEYSAIAFRSARNVEFDYRLSGAGKEWVRTGSNRIDLPGMKPGKYHIEVKAVNTITGEESETRSIAFEILIPWYQSLWFMSLMLILLVIIVWWLVRRRISMIRRQSAETTRINKQFVELEMQALRAQMNPHFIFNAMSAIQNYFVDNKEEKANAYMSKFARLIRQMLDYSRDNFIPLDEEISLLSNYMLLEKMRFEAKLDFSLKLDPQIDTSEFVLPSLLLQPLLENAVNHGIMPAMGKGVIELDMRLEPGYLICEISDNGIGINQSRMDKIQPQGHISKGMDILTKRIESINQLYSSHVSFEIYDLADRSGNSGTRIIIRFPVSLVDKTILKNS
jgi:hypothetical protein